MDEQEANTLRLIEELGKKLPKFPDGRINYSNAHTAPVISVFVRFDGKILLLKRSDKVSTYKGKWNAVGGYLDEIKPIRKKILGEVKEELGIGEDNIMSIRLGRSYEFNDKEIGKTWIVHPVLVELKERQDIKLDWEHTECRWIEADEIKNFDTVPQTERSWKNLL